MKIEFLTLLNESNCIKNNETHEYLLTTPIIEAEGEYQITCPMIITSNCNTIIKCEIIEVYSDSVSFSNILFETNIIVDKSKKFSLHNCSITSTQKVSDSVISIVYSEDVLIDNCKINESNDCTGVIINFDSSATIQNTEISHHQNSLLICGNGSIVTVNNCNFHHSNGNGIYWINEGKITVDHCTISDTKCPPILLNGPQCKVNNNVISNCPQDGICVYNSDDFTIENNTISNMGSSAISIRSEARGIIKSNKISEIGGNGSYIEYSNVDVCDNLICRTNYPAVVIMNQSTVTLKNNKIKNIKTCGIAGRNAKSITITNNEIDEILECGISLSSTDICIIENNTISNCAISSIESYNKSNAIVQNNIISKSGKYAFFSYTMGQIKAQNNQIDNVGDSMVKLSHKGSGEFIDNKINDCKNQCENKTTSFYYFARNGNFESVTNDIEKVNENSVKFEKTTVNDDLVLCLKCNKNQRDCYLMRCGHRIYCRECAKLALQKKENCPLCRFPIIQVSEGFKMNGDDQLCILCFENVPDTIIMPCGHTGVCSSCLNNWLKENRVCPCCRTSNPYYNKIETSL